MAAQLKQAKSVNTYLHVREVSLESRNVYGFALLYYTIGLKIPCHFFIQSEVKTRINFDSLARVSLRFMSVTCIYFEFLLVYWIACVLCDWLNRPFAAKPSRDPLFINLWAATYRIPEMEKACQKHQNGQFEVPE